MVLDTITEFYETNLENLEKDLTNLSLKSEIFTLDADVLAVKEKYRRKLIDQINDTLTDDCKYYINSYLDLWFMKSFTTIHDLNKRRLKIKDNMVMLKQLQLPDQRSEEWYKIRENLLTASSLADALGKGHFQTRDGLLISKTSENQFC